MFSRSTNETAVYSTREKSMHTTLRRSNMPPWPPGNLPPPWIVYNESQACHRGWAQERHHGIDGSDGGGGGGEEDAMMILVVVPEEEKIKHATLAAGEPPTVDCAPKPSVTEIWPAGATGAEDLEVLLQGHVHESHFGSRRTVICPPGGATDSLLLGHMHNKHFVSVEGSGRTEIAPPGEANDILLLGHIHNKHFVSLEAPPNHIVEIWPAGTNVEEDILLLGYVQGSHYVSVEGSRRTEIAPPGGATDILLLGHIHNQHFVSLEAPQNHIVEIWPAGTTGEEDILLLGYVQGSHYVSVEGSVRTVIAPTGEANDILLLGHIHNKHFVWRLANPKGSRSFGFIQAPQNHTVDIIPECGSEEADVLLLRHVQGSHYVSVEVDSVPFSDSDSETDHIYPNVCQVITNYSQDVGLTGQCPLSDRYGRVESGLDTDGLSLTVRMQKSASHSNSHKEVWRTGRMGIQEKEQENLDRDLTELEQNRDDKSRCMDLLEPWLEGNGETP
ncbi:hypothetical protein Bbelb_235760 [Branchiostoma belcheri]|nr:hypothetical protein Bbelb_235760 [Branchiostoma belcheri]